MNIYFTDVFRSLHHFACIYTFELDFPYIWFTQVTWHRHLCVVCAPCCSWFVRTGSLFLIQDFESNYTCVPVHKKVFFSDSLPRSQAGTLRSWSSRHQSDACASRWCPTDANPSAPIVWGVSTFSLALKEEMKTSLGITEEVALSSWSPYICYDFLL